MALEPPMPPDLENKIRDVVANLDGVETRLRAIETQLRLQDALSAQVRDLRHDFNNARQTLKLLLEELDQRLPVKVSTKQ